MKIEEALNYVDILETAAKHAGPLDPLLHGPVITAVVLAAEVRRQRENLTQLLTGLECRNIELAVNENTPDAFKLIGELIAHQAKQNTGYPPALDVCNMEYRGNSVGHIYQKMEAYRYQLGQVKTLNAETRKQAADLCDMILNGKSELIDLGRVKRFREKLGAGDE